MKRIIAITAGIDIINDGFYFSILGWLDRDLTNYIILQQGIIERGF
jgi:hypothetical protein